MNWKAYTAQRNIFGPDDRFSWPSDGIASIDCSPGFTISDLWGAISWVWTWPGDYLLSTEPMKTFFEIEGATAIGATGSTVFGWVIAIFVLLILAETG